MLASTDTVLLSNVRKLGNSDLSRTSCRRRAGVGLWNWALTCPFIVRLHVIHE
jgi:hypothetical protein